MAFIVWASVLINAQIKNREKKNTQNSNEFYKFEQRIKKKKRKFENRFG